MTTTDPRNVGAPPLPLSERTGNGQTRAADSSSLSPSSKRAGKQPMLREPIDSIVSETSFVTNPYAAGGPVATPSPGPINAPPGLHPIPIPQPSSFILPPLNFVPLAGGYFTTATAYATSFLPGSHPLRLSVALEHSAFLWDCLHDQEGSRRIARRAIKDVYRAQEAMDDSEFEDAAELVGILGRMMKRKSWEGTPRVPGVGSPEPAPGVPPGAPSLEIAQASSSSAQRNDKTSLAPAQAQTSPPPSRRAAEGPPFTHSPAGSQSRGATRSRSSSASKPAPRQSGSHENTPRMDTQRFTGGGSQETTPRARHLSVESGASTTPRAPQGAGGRSPATPSTVRTVQQPGSGGSTKNTPVVGHSTPISPSAAATLASDAVRMSPTLRRSPPLRLSPTQESTYNKQR